MLGIFAGWFLLFVLFRHEKLFQELYLKVARKD